MSMACKYAIKAIVDGQEAFLQHTGYGKIQFKMRKDQLTFARLRAKGGEIVGRYDATLMNEQAVNNTFDLLTSRPELFPEIASPEIVRVS